MGCVFAAHMYSQQSWRQAKPEEPSHLAFDWLSERLLILTSSKYCIASRSSRSSATTTLCFADQFITTVSVSLEIFFGAHPTLLSRRHMAGVRTAASVSLDSHTLLWQVVHRINRVPGPNIFFFDGIAKQYICVGNSAHLRWHLRCRRRSLLWGCSGPPCEGVNRQQMTGHQSSTQRMNSSYTVVDVVHGDAIHLGPQKRSVFALGRVTSVDAPIKGLSAALS